MVTIMQFQTKSPGRPIEIVILLYPRFSNLCLANALEPLRAANDFAAREAYRWRVASLDGGPVLASSRLRVEPDGKAEAMGRCDYLFVLSSYDVESFDTAANRQTLRRAAAQAAITVGFDTGGWLMAGAGLLRGRRATVHRDMLDAFAERFLDLDAVRSRWEADGPVITCAGATAAFDLARHMVRQHLGTGLGLDVDGLFLTDPAAASSPPRGDPVLRRALELMRANLETPLSLDALARVLNVGPRTLSRRFQAGLGESPGAVYRHVRLSAAHQMVENGTLGVGEIALRCGYDSPAALTRAFRARFGRSPQQLRREIAQSGL